MDSIAEGIKSLAGNITSGLGDKFREYLSAGVSDILIGLSGIPVNVIEGMNEVISLIMENSDNFLVGKIGDLWESANDILLSGFHEMLQEIFVPDEDYISEKVNSIRTRFAFADSIMTTAESISSAVKNSGSSGPPKLTINLGLAESKYDYGGSALALDMSWYARYKPSVDVVLSSIIWVLFVWRVFVHLPNIISGFGGDVVSYAEYVRSDDKRGRKK